MYGCPLTLSCQLNYDTAHSQAMVSHYSFEFLLESTRLIEEVREIVKKNRQTKAIAILCRRCFLELASGSWDNRTMTSPSLPQPHEQRKIEQLLIRLSKMKPVSAKPAPIVQRLPALRAGRTARPQIFFST
jgi:hypothetical protein